MLDVAQWVVGALAVGGAGASMFLGWRNLEQATLLENDLAPGQLGAHVGRAVTVVGTPTSDYGGDDPFHRRWLWFRREFQEYDRHRNNPSWRTVREETAPWHFSLDVGGRSVRVENAPTEVYGTETETSGGGWGEDYRTITEVLPIPPRLTVCGALVSRGQELWVVPDRRLGLLFAPEPPHRRARRERIKGWLGLVGGPLGIIALALWLTSAGGPLSWL